MTHVAPRSFSTFTSNLTSRDWWHAAIVRALRTAILIAVPYLGAAGLLDEIPWLAVASAAALGFILSLFTSLAGLTESTGATVPVWLALLERVTKTVAQALAAGIGNAVLFQDVDWSVIVQAALVAGLGSLLLGFLTNLPEAAEPIASRTTNITIAPAGQSAEAIARATAEALERGRTHTGE